MLFPTVPLRYKSNMPYHGIQKNQNVQHLK